MLKSTQRPRHEARFSEIVFREARVDEFETLCAIDLDASRLFDQVGLELTEENSVEFAAAERSRWLECLTSGTVLVATTRSEGAIGFAAVRLLDSEPYLEQLSVRLPAMRNGIGSALLMAAGRVAVKMRAQSLWLTTYRHVPWNGPFYGRAGFTIVPDERCGSEMLQELSLQRRLLPAPDERVAMRKVLRASD